MKVSRNGEYYNFYDGLGSTRVMTDAAGQVVNRYTCGAYGTLLDNEIEDTVPNEYRFTGERVDADTGLVYLRARYYDPNTGRFIHLDQVIGDAYDPQSLHRYLYSYDDPANRIDPNGQTSFSEVMTSTRTLARLFWEVAKPVWNIYDKVESAKQLLPRQW